MTDASGTTRLPYDSWTGSREGDPGRNPELHLRCSGEPAIDDLESCNGVSASYSYDDLNRLARWRMRTWPGVPPTSAYTYDNASNVGTVTYPNGVTTQFTYDTLNR